MTMRTPEPAVAIAFTRKAEAGAEAKAKAEEEERMLRRDAVLYWLTHRRHRLPSTYPQARTPARMSTRP